MVIFTYFANLDSIKPLYFPACRSSHVDGSHCWDQKSGLAVRVIGGVLGVFSVGRHDDTTLVIKNPKAEGKKHRRASGRVQVKTPSLRDDSTSITVLAI
jgi:hypothetical protein